MIWFAIGALLLAPTQASPPEVTREVQLPADPQAGATLTVAEFLAGLRVLNKVGPEKAEQDSLYVKATTGLMQIGEDYRTDIRAARASGTAFESCPPGKEVTLTTDLLLPYLLAMSAQEQQQPMAQAFRAYMRDHYPCPPKGK